MSDPSLEHLVRALTASGHSYERTGRDAALAAFRAAGPQRVRPGARAGRWRRNPSVLRPVRAAAVAAACALLLAGVTAAAYAQALPASFQRIAHNVFAPLGVPGAQHRSVGHTRPPKRTAPAASPGKSPATAIVQPPATAAATLPAASSAPAAGSPTARATPTTQATPTATAPAEPSIQLQLVTGRVIDHLVVVISAPAGRPGGRVVLAELINGTWQPIMSRQQGMAHQIRFQVKASAAMGHLFRAVLTEPGADSPAESNIISVPNGTQRQAK